MEEGEDGGELCRMIVFRGGEARARSNGRFIVIQREINDVDIGAHNRIGNVRVAKRSSVV